MQQSNTMTTESKALTIHTNEPVKELGDLFGLFFEDINHAADGGLYAELIQNRSFEFCEIDNPEYHALTAWEKSEHLVWEIKTSNGPSKKNPHTLHISGVAQDYFYNDGFGIGIYCEAGKEYHVTLRTKAESKESKISVCLMNQEGDTFSKISDSCVLSISPDDFSIYEGSLHVFDTTQTGRFVITLEEDSTLIFDALSLFPTDTYKGRPNGLRKDLAEALEAMKPKFLRFPGGCLVHDGSLDSEARNSLYRWKNTLGPTFDRPAKRNNWGYNQTLGLGYYEYFLLCEDLNAEPLPVLPAGFNPHKGEGCDMNRIQEWVEEALDLIEFATGDPSTPWGKVRSELGHKKPFGLKYLAIGNEEIGDGFFERYPYFHEAIREKYPDIQIINSAGPFAVGEGYETGWNSARKYHSDLVDEHYYSNPEWFLANMHHYDSLDPNGPGVFLGEYASWGNTYYNAIVEAAYMTHLEKAKAVKLACYAPLFCNVNYKNWTPDMIFFQGKDMLLTANYHVQKMFMEHQGETEVAVSANNLSEITKLTKDTGLTGGFSIAGNSIEGTITNLVVSDLSSGETLQRIDSLEITDNAEHDLFDIPVINYVLEFDFKRTKGRKGLYIRLGKTEGNNHIVWEFGGWDNWDCNIQYVQNGRGATISHNIFHVEDIPYHLRMEVHENQIKTYVNGKNWNDVMIPQPQLEELYYCASTSENGETILKVVNLTTQDKAVTVRMDGTDKQYKSAYLTVLSGNQLTDENTFENPSCICPVKKKSSVQNNQLDMVFPHQSVSVIQFQ